MQRQQMRTFLTILLSAIALATFLSCPQAWAPDTDPLTPPELVASKSD